MFRNSIVSNEMVDKCGDKWWLARSVIMLTVLLNVVAEEYAVSGVCLHYISFTVFQPTRGIILYFIAFRFIFADDIRSLRQTRNVFAPKKYSSMQKHVVDSEEKAATNKTRQSVRPRTHLSQHMQLPFDPYAFRCTAAEDVACENRTALFAQHVLAEFRRSLSKAEPCVGPPPEIASDNAETTTSSTTVVPTTQSPSLPSNPACLLMDAKVRTLRQTDGPFRDHPVGAWLPHRRLLHNVLGAVGAKARGRRTCAIVASAGSLNRSGLGAFIGMVSHIHYTHDA